MRRELRLFVRQRRGGTQAGIVISLRGLSRVLLACAVFLTTAAATQADPVDDYIKMRMTEAGLPGLALVVIKDGDVIKTAGYGLADVARRVPVTPDTVFKIGSVSKQFIATAVMLLVQDGRLSVDDPVSRFLDGTPPAWRPIRVRHLLAHTSGLVREAPGFDPFKIQSDAAVIASAHTAPLRFQPGERYEYSNLGYFALAEIVTRVSGRPWTEYLGDRVFVPSRMLATRTTTPSGRVANAAVGYTGDDHRQEAPSWAAIRPSGAFLSTVLDLAKWDAVLGTENVLSGRSRGQMWTPAVLNGGSVAPYGFGWQIGAINGHKAVYHGGGMPGFVSQFVRFVDQHLTIIALMNGDDADRDGIVFGIAAFYLPTSPQGIR